MAKELQRWECYVDDIDDTHVYLMMADLTVDRGDEREIGTFPKHLFDHLEPRLGQYVTVTVTDDGMVIANTEIDSAALEVGARKRDELLGLLAELRSA